MRFSFNVQEVAALAVCAASLTNGLYLMCWKLHIAANLSNLHSCFCSVLF